MDKFLDPGIDATFDMIAGSGDIPVTNIGEKIGQTVLEKTVC